MDTPKVFYPGRRALPKAAAFWILAVLFLMLFFASAAASPLYPVYQVRFDFSAATLTAVVAVYVLVTEMNYRAVKDLTKDEFEIVESKLSQAITVFEFVSIPLSKVAT